MILLTTALNQVKVMHFCNRSQLINLYFYLILDKNNTFQSIDQGISEKSDKDEKLFDDLLSMEFIESRELKRNDSDSDKENKDTISNEDPFGFGLDSINNHRKSLINSTMSNSFLDIKGYD